MVLHAALRHHSTTDLAAIPAALVNIELEVPDWSTISATLKKLGPPAFQAGVPRHGGDARDI